MNDKQSKEEVATELAKAIIIAKTDILEGIAGPVFAAISLRENLLKNLQNRTS